MHNCFKRFSVFVECSTGSTPKVQTLKNYIDLISAFGYNEMYLGCTDAYKIEGEPYFNYKRGGYTKAEFRELDAYAKSRGVTLIASVQTLAHLHFMSRHNVYSGLFDTDDILLVGEEKVYRFIEKIFATISEGLSCRRIHIGFDEAFGLGTGNYLKRNGFKKKRELLAEHLGKVTEIARRYGYTCEIWSDMFLHVTEGEDTSEIQIPDNVELITWEYDEQRGDVLDGLISRTKTLCDRAGYAGAAWKINGFAPQNAYSLSRLLPQMRSCLNNGIEHFIITLWSDAGGLVSIFSVLPVLYAAARFARGDWNGEGAPDKGEFEKITGLSYDELNSLEYLNDPFKKNILTKNSRSYWCLFNDILLGNYDLYLSEGTNGQYARLAEEYEAIGGGTYRYLFEEAASLARLLSVKAELGLEVRSAYKKRDKIALKKIADESFPLLYIRLAEFTEKFEAYWERENMAFGAECVQLLLGGQSSRYRYIEKKIRGYVERDESIEELETETLLPSIIPQTDEDSCFEMNWRLLTSFCGI